ncbi:MAG: hypothetical protein QXP36_04170 [Conexivisphaerales archaeon]|uniref:hypothetical protein n=1 Tax=Saccharolobus sp. TaxID=2100761 RepID=UPI0031717C90
MPRTCKVCGSPMREQLEAMRREGKSLKNILLFSIQNNLGLTYKMLQYHFLFHMDKDKVKNNIESLIPTELVTHLIKNLQICDDKISKMLTEDKVDHKTLLKYLVEIRQTISTLKELLSEYHVKLTTPNEIFHLLLSLMHDFPVEYIKKIQERYLKWKENPDLSPIEY